MKLRSSGVDSIVDTVTRARTPSTAGVPEVRERTSVGMPVEEGESAAAVERLLEASWDERNARFAPRELAAGAAISVAFLIAAVTLASLAPALPARVPVPMIVALAMGFAIASRVEFPIGAGYAVPTQLYLVPLFILAPPAFVPLIVFASLGVAGVVDTVRRRVRGDRLVDIGVDAWHSIAPAVVIVLAGAPNPVQAPAGFLVLAFTAQVTSEVATSSLRLWLGKGLSPHLHLRVLLTVWAIDLLLTPVAFVVASAALVEGLEIAPITLLGFIVLLALVTRDRTQRIDQAHARLEALRTERSRLETAVQRIGDAFASKLDLDALLNITMRAAVEALDAEGARASANPGAGRRLVRRAKTHDVPELEPAMAAAEQAAARTGALSVVERDGVVAVACPVQDPAGLPQAGMLVLARRGTGFPPRKQELLQYLCNRAGVAASDIEKHATLHRQALTDELTGLANHRRLQEVLAFGAKGHEQSGEPLALILFDLDDFKQINDTRGHQTGDQVLRAVSDVLRGCCRSGDEAARYGGEELAIVMHASDLPAVVSVAERARAAVAALDLVDVEGRDLSVTTSVGVASLGPGIRDPRALIAAADAALYEAKRAGKNRVHFHGGTAAA